MKKQPIIAWSIEFGPIILFFILLETIGSTDSGFITATAAFTLATIVALMASYCYEKRIALFPLVAGIFVVFFGLFTVGLEEPYLFVLKDTFYNGFFFIVLLVGILKNVGYLQYLFGSLFDLTQKGWYKLSFMWMVMFLLLTVSNELFWHVYGIDAWVRYKIIATIITVVFGTYQIFLARDYRMETASPWGLRVTPLKKKSKPEMIIESKKSE